MRKIKHLNIEYNYESNFIFEQKIKELTNNDLNLLISLHNDISKDLMNETKQLLIKKGICFEDDEIDVRTYDIIRNEFFKERNFAEMDDENYSPLKKELKYTENTNYTYDSFKYYLRLGAEGYVIQRFNNYYLNNKYELENEIQTLAYKKEDELKFSDFEIMHFELYCSSVMSNLEEKIFYQYNLLDNSYKNDDTDLTDLSDTSAIEKIIYLQKLGVIDFLRTKQPFISSINSLATVLSAVTGAKSGTIQPMLNAMLSINVNDKNNPLNSPKPTNKVTKQLIQIGFNVDETI